MNNIEYSDWIDICLYLNKTYTEANQETFNLSASASPTKHFQQPSQDENFDQDFWDSIVDFYTNDSSMMKLVGAIYFNKNFKVVETGKVEAETDNEQPDLELASTKTVSDLNSSATTQGTTTTQDQMVLTTQHFSVTQVETQVESLAETPVTQTLTPLTEVTDTTLQEVDESADQTKLINQVNTSEIAPTQSSLKNPLDNTELLLNKLSTEEISLEKEEDIAHPIPLNPNKKRKVSLSPRKTRNNSKKSAVENQSSSSSSSIISEVNLSDVEEEVIIESPQKSSTSKLKSPTEKPKAIFKPPSTSKFREMNRRLLVDDENESLFLERTTWKDPYAIAMLIKGYIDYGDNLKLILLKYQDYFPLNVTIVQIKDKLRNIIKNFRGETRGSAYVEISEKGDQVYFETVYKKGRKVDPKQVKEAFKDLLERDTWAEK